MTKPDLTEQVRKSFYECRKALEDGNDPFPYLAIIYPDPDDPTKPFVYRMEMIERDYRDVWGSYQARVAIYKAIRLTRRIMPVDAFVLGSFVYKILPTERARRKPELWAKVGRGETDGLKEGLAVQIPHMMVIGQSPTDAVLMQQRVDMEECQFIGEPFFEPGAEKGLAGTWCVFDDSAEALAEDEAVLGSIPADEFVDTMVKIMKEEEER